MIENEKNWNSFIKKNFNLIKENERRKFWTGIHHSLAQLLG